MNENIGAQYNKTNYCNLRPGYFTKSLKKICADL